MLIDITGKPVLLIGLAGTGISMFIFGFARNFQTILIARALGGLLNGNVGVLQTTVAEVVTAKEHQALAYSIMPFIWTLGNFHSNLQLQHYLIHISQAPLQVPHLVVS
jgi:predicted MFS family arabinose efflux permease